MAITFPIAFEKMSGTGNDFVIIDNRTAGIPLADTTDLPEKYVGGCFPLGRTALYFIEESTKADFGWNFYNADGSVAEMCGNGSRCAARFAYAIKLPGRR